MIKIGRKMTSVIIILLGLFVTAPTLFADPAQPRRRRPAVRQEVAPRLQRRCKIFSFLNGLHRKMRRNRVKRQIKRNVRRRHVRRDARRDRYEHRNNRPNRP